MMPTIFKTFEFGDHILAGGQEDQLNDCTVNKIWSLGHWRFRTLEVRRCCALIILANLLGLSNVVSQDQSRTVCWRGPGGLLEPSPGGLHGMHFWAVLESDISH